MTMGHSSWSGMPPPLGTALGRNHGRPPVTDPNSFPAVQEAATTAHQVSELRTAVAGLQQSLIGTFSLQSVQFASSSGGIGSAEDLRQQHAALSNLQVRLPALPCTPCFS